MAGSDLLYPHPPEARIKLLLWGTSDKGKPRTRILLDALRRADVDVREVHCDIWTGVEDKSQLSSLERLQRYAKWLSAYPLLLVRFLTAPKPDAILLGYPAQLDVLVIKLAARLRGVPILMDLFISIYDTTVNDRGLVQPNGIKARILRQLERFACRAADRVLIDTAAHARHVEQLLDLERGSLGDVPVGVEREHFEVQPPAPPAQRPLILFYGQLIPLHGIETVVAAALSQRGESFDWVIIGSGQEEAKLKAALGSNPPKNVRWIRWAPYTELQNWIGRSHICLGIFGGSRKAASVVPNKVYQALSCGRHVVTRASPAMAQLTSTSLDGVTLVEPGCSESLLDGIEDAVRRGCPPPSAVLLDSFSSDHIAARLIGYLQDLRGRVPAGGRRWISIKQRMASAQTRGTVR